MMVFSETAEHTLMRDSLREIASRFGHDYYVENARTGGHMAELWQELGRSGFLGANIPQEYGGAGMGITELAIVCEEVARQGCPNIFLIVSPAICASIITRFGSEEQKKRWLPSMASGERRIAFAITEPDAGSNAHNISTSAVPDGDGYRLSGTKYFISGVDQADEVLVVARTGTDERGRAQLSLFIVETDAPGLVKNLIPVEMVSTEKQFMLFFDNVRVEADQVLGKIGDGFRQVFSGLNPERITSAAVVNGIGLYALEKAARYARERQVWSVPIGAHQGIAHPLAEAKIQVELARLMTSKAAWLFDQGLDAGEAANMAKFAGADAASFALDRAIQTHGGNGLASEYGLADMWGVVRLFRLAPISREMILNFVAQHSLGLPKSY
jgi:alkylation response protein AidB-like acyl-CoA dehydrogenase